MQLVKFFIIIISSVLSVYANPAGALFVVSKGNKEQNLYRVINTDLDSSGYTLTGSLERINDGYKEKFGKTDLDNLGFFSVVNYGAIRPLLLKEPRLGAFTPFTLHIYKKSGDDKSYIGHIAPDAMLDMTKVSDAKVRAEFLSMFSPLDKLLKDEIGGKIKNLTYDSLPAKTMIEFEYDIDAAKDIYDQIDDFCENFETAFEDKNYSITGYVDFYNTYRQRGLKFNTYDAYFVYTLCSFKFSEAIFNRGRPDVGIFAPCSIYMYIEKGSGRMVIGMSRVENWAAVMHISDEKMLDEIHLLDSEIVSILKSLGAKER